MHGSSLKRMKCFVENYCLNDGKRSKRRVLDVGSYDVSGGTYKVFFPEGEFEYVGLDIAAGPNVDVVPEDMYCWDSIQDESFDYIISGQAFEHIEYPWLTIAEMAKKLKKDGLICIIAPNGGFEHKYPLDCWRFYGDGMRALAKWGGLEVIEVSVGGIPCEEADSVFDDIWNDVCLVACRPESAKRNAYKKMFPLERRNDPYRQAEELMRQEKELMRQGKLFQELCHIKAQLKGCRDIYIYGAGKNGKAIADFFDKAFFPYKGFVVSDGKRLICEQENQNIYKISDMPPETGIVVSPRDNDEIYKILKERKMKYVADGLNIVKILS